VEPDLSLAGHPEVFVVGDLAALRQDGDFLPGVAPVAIQQGRYVAKAIEARIAGRTVPPFRYRDRGSLAVIGRARAVALVWGRRFWGYPAWLLWLFVHLLYLVEFESRVLVVIQWGWSYLTRNRRARLITGASDSR
jgi:NADH dehydrogenase